MVIGQAAQERYGAVLARAGLPHVWHLRGPLGAGKTTLVRGIARALGVRSSVTSPTFSLKRDYRLRRQPWERLVHIDAYRLSRPDEVRALELDELVRDPRVLLIVEWPQKIRSFRWGWRAVVTMAHAGRGRRLSVRVVG